MIDKGDEPAFPHVTHVTATGIATMAPGLTKREVLEALAMVAVMINTPAMGPDGIAPNAKCYANAMLEMWEERG